jgi:hypothetical protein
VSTPEPAYDHLELLGLHEPETGDIGDGSGAQSHVELPGFYTVGFMRNGSFRRLFTFKAAGMLADEARAQAAQAAPPPPDAPTQ